MALLMGPDLKFHMKMPIIRFDMGFIRLITNDYYTIGTSFKWFSLKAYAYNLEWRELFDSKIAAVDYVFRLKFFFLLHVVCSVCFSSNTIFSTQKHIINSQKCIHFFEEFCLFILFLYPHYSINIISFTNSIYWKTNSVPFNATN